ncbi:hypothetical protein H0H92_003091 [Tricholoma furcatifolium]|nr:hypothetical protein H0H92_003091 [Tricholoma furcatifolium]
MSGIKRTVSTRSARLSARTSPYNAAVTLLEANDVDPASTRRSKRIKIETKVEDIVQSALEELSEPVASGSSTPAAKKSSNKSPRKPKPIQQSLAVPHPAPERWKETYDTIRDMRSRIAAPVDTMGCAQAQFKETDPKTKDEVTDAAVSKLRAALGGSLSVDALIAADDATITEAIAKVGFWRRKTEYIKKAAQRLRDDFDSDVPKTVDELCSLPGVGPKMAFLTLQVAWNLNVGIGVDVHVHRITNRLGWHKPPTKDPEETRLNLQSWLPAEFHRDINPMLVGFGQVPYCLSDELYESLKRCQVICLPVGPRCDVCELSTKGLCPSAQKASKSKSRKAITLAPALSVSEALPKVEIEIKTEEEKAILYTISDPPSPDHQTKSEESW